MLKFHDQTIHAATGKREGRTQLHVKHWHILPIEVVELPLLQVFQTRTDKCLWMA